MKDYQPRYSNDQRTSSRHIPERAHIDSTSLLIDTIERLGKWEDAA